MPKRKKRLQKGIESLAHQINIHKLKQEKALKEGKMELVEYYSKEISAKEADRKYKEEKLNRK